MSTESHEQGRTGVQIVVALILVTAAVLVAILLTKSKPRAKRGQGKRLAALVETMPIAKGDHQLTIQTGGIVGPSRKVTLFPRVSGELITVSDALVQGSLLKRGQVIARIDPSDYLLAMKRAQSTLTQARATLRLERGSHEVARSESKLLSDLVASGDRSLVLREPQLRIALANVLSASAALDLAQLNLDRTKIRAPFNSVVLSRAVARGSQVSPSTPVATLAGTETWWIEVAIPIDQLRWVRLPGADSKGATVQVVTQGGLREGHVVQLLAEVEQGGSLALLLVAVSDPMASKESPGTPRLLGNAWVEVIIEGNPIEDCFVIDRRYLHDGNTVWIMTAEETLDIREVSLLAGVRERVFIRNGIEDGERIVTSYLATPVRGMKLRTEAKER